MGCRVDPGQLAGSGSRRPRGGRSRRSVIQRPCLVRVQASRRRRRPLRVSSTSTATRGAAGRRPRPYRPAPAVPRGVRKLDGAIGRGSYGFAAQLPLRQPRPPRGCFAPGRGARRRRVDVGQLGDDEGPDRHVQADQPQGLGEGATHSWPSRGGHRDQATVLPAVKDLPQRLLPTAQQLVASRVEPTQQDPQDVGAAAYCCPSSAGRRRRGR